MQHYRLPTRLLDWTESPLTALFFAVEDRSPRPAAVWGLDPFALNAARGGARVILSPSDLRASALIQAGFSGTAAPDLTPIAMLGDEIDLRMLMQLSAFTLHGDATAHEDAVNQSDIVAKIEIPAGAKLDLLNALDLLGVRRSSLFPDLENLSLDLRDRTFQEPSV